MEQDEIYLVDLWRIFSREWKWFVGVLLLTLACTYAFAHLVKRQWESTAWIQIGQVGQVPGGQNPLVEPLARVLERLQMVPFQNEIMKSLGFAPTSAEAQLFRKSMKLEPLPYAGPLIRMNVRGFSQEQAIAMANATVAQLHLLHQRLEQLPTKSAQARLVEVQGDLQTALADRDRFMQASAAGDGKNTRDPLLANMLLSSKNDEIRNLQQAKNDLLDRLGPVYTFETSMPWPAYVPDKQAFPNPELTYGIGVLLAFFLASLATLARSATRRSA
ncbi:Wzz/FepE/Etk N-terminal domain-containing protein [Rhodanobacter sp. L36]|uniref:Wzz/FepE/Etk N-terminal domain-containing protein n=1 Tax=Rhodanobacter sp. L36 TaxID=1747221 RepID=UPI00131D1BDD|nr:Wzz/FepE/Etk N-terminal domain-containing protein [Rhodanobacter sp. L36]